MTPPAREQRFVFGEVAETYDRTRPGYPDAAFDLILSGLPHRPTAVEAGAGTGKASVALAIRCRRLVAVEPVAEMAAVARRHLQAYPHAEVVESTFEAWEPGDMRAELVVCAQAWHWLDQGAALTKAAHLLRDGGRLALMWNAPSYADADLGGALDSLYQRVAPDLARSRPWQRMHPDTMAAVEADGRFEQPRSAHVRHDVSYNSADYCDLMRTQSDHRLLDSATHERLLAEIASVIDSRGGVLTVSYETVILTMERAVPR